LHGIALVREKAIERPSGENAGPVKFEIARESRRRCDPSGAIA